MARLPRYAAPGMPQRVIQHGNHRCVLFVADSGYRFFRDSLRAACEHHGCRVHAYVFMTNHVHLLMTPASAAGISAVMHSVGRTLFSEPLPDSTLVAIRDACGGSRTARSTRSSESCSAP